MSDDTTGPVLPLRLNDLNGFSTNEGPTFDGGWFTGGGPVRDRSLVVRVLTPMGRTPSVEIDLIEASRHGCTASLPPDLARQVAAAIMAAADRADAEMQKWRDVLDKQRAELREMADRATRSMAGLDEETE